MRGDGNRAETPEERRERILAACVEACEKEGIQALERFCAEDPDLAAEMRRAVRTALELRAASSSGLEGIPVRVERIGKFRILERLGGGGMGVLYRARDPSLGRDVAIKVLAAPLSTIPGALERFRREARAVAQLHHPHVVAVHDVGETSDGLPYLVMDLVEGESLEAILRRLEGADPKTLRASDLLATRAKTGEGPSPEAGAGSYVEAVVRLAAKVADALDHAHRCGVIHRDVKPGNILVDRDGEPRLVDFGLARDLGATALTLTGSAPGTPYYMPPEQIAGSRAKVDPRTDVFSLGATLYEALTLQRTFRGDNTAQVFQQVLWKEPIRPRRLNPAIPPDLETVCLKALEKDSERRYASAALFAEDLRNLLALRPIVARPAGPITRTTKWVRRNRAVAAAVAVAIMAVLTGGGVLLGREWSEARENRELRAEAEQSVDGGEFDRALDLLSTLIGKRRDDAEALRRREEVLALRNRSLARLAIEDAARLLDRFRRDAGEASDMASEIDRLRVAQAIEPVSATEQERLLDLQNRFARRRPELATLFYGVLEKLNEAERHDPGNSERVQVYADLLVERWRTAERMGDLLEARFLEDWLVREHSDRLRTEESRDRGSAAFLTVPAGAQIFLFRYVEESDLRPEGDPRLLPVPVGNPKLPVPPGTFALRVLRGVDPIEPQDLILRVAGFPIEDSVLAVRGNDRLGIRPLDRLDSIDGERVRDEGEVYSVGLGREDLHRRDHPNEPLPSRVLEIQRLGEPPFTVQLSSFEDVGVEFREPRFLVERGGIDAEVYHMGETRSLLLPEGLSVRVTANPFFLGEACHLGKTPLDPIPLDSGSYVALLRREDHEDVRYPFLVRPRNNQVIEVTLYPEGTSPQGFVYVPPGPFLLGGDPDAVGSLPGENLSLGGFWIMEREMTNGDYEPFLKDPEIQLESETSFWGAWRSSDGTYHVPPEHRDEPLGAISHEDAERYASWRTKLALERGEPFVFSLPTYEEWEKAARGADGRIFVYGNHFVSWWSNTRLARRNRATYRPMSFPIDESPFGVFDLGGNLAEWCVPNPPKEWNVKGGSWVNPLQDRFRVAARNQEAPDTSVGFRLVARLRAPH